MSAPVTSSSTSSIQHLQRLGIIEIEGKDAERFLQGQISANLAHANGIYAPYGVFCTPKGRVIANVQLLRAEPERYWLLCSSSLVTILLEHLNKYAVFFRKTTLTQRDDLAVYGVTGNTDDAAKALNVTTLPRHSGEAAIHDGQWIIHAAGENRWLVIRPAIANHTEQPAIMSSNISQNESNWWQEEIRQGVAWLDEQQSDAWLPQMINWESLGGISFKKGCYTGQEVVARAHYRGQVKKRLARYSTEEDVAIHSGDNIEDVVKQRSVGTVVAAERIGDTTELLAVVTLSEEPRTLTVNNAKLHPETLPYDIERKDPEVLLSAIEGTANIQD